MAIRIPDFLIKEVSIDVTGRDPRVCDFCGEVACETPAMLCGECTGQTCSGQCSASQCGQCTSCLGGGCQTSCQTGANCQTSCQSSCQSSCESSAQGDAPYGSGTITVLYVTGTTIAISYTPIMNAAYYEIAYRRSDVTNATVRTSGTLTYTITGLEPRTTYVINYRGTNNYGNSGFINGTTATTGSGRPDNWEWYSTIYQNEDILLSAREMTAFQQRINMFRSYSGTYEYQFPAVYSGSDIGAWDINHCIDAIRGMSPPINPPAHVASGDVIAAWVFLRLRDSLNSIQ